MNPLLVHTEKNNSLGGYLGFELAVGHSEQCMTLSMTTLRSLGDLNQPEAVFLVMCDPSMNKM